MSHGTGLGQDRHAERDFVIATPEEFCKRFGGTKVINKVNIIYGLFSQNITKPINHCIIEWMTEEKQLRNREIHQKSMGECHAKRHFVVVVYLFSKRNRYIILIHITVWHNYPTKIYPLE